MSIADEKQQMDRVRERFTRTAAAFSDFALSNRAGEAERLAEMTSPTGEELALDLACGPGTLARIFAKRVKRILGLDLTPALLGRARKEAADERLTNFFAVCGDGLKMPFRGGSLNLIVTSYSVHHLSDASAATREVARVLRRGGKFGLLDMVVPENQAHAEKNNAIERARDVSHTRTLPCSEFESLFVRCGFRIIAKDTAKRTRSFDDWMRVAGWKRKDPAYEESRRLLEASIPGDTAGFQPRILAEPAKESSDNRPDIEMTQSAAFFVAQKQ
jgi:ubiquinone/menaquinone biosynthesis C-methylase UbiE